MTQTNNPTIDAKELAVAETAAEKEIKGVYVHTFKEPFVYEEKTYEKLVFDWGSLTGEDALRIEHELASQGINVIAPEFSGDYLIRMAVRACSENIGADVLSAIPLWDFNRIRNKARSFLLNAGR